MPDPIQEAIWEFQTQEKSLIDAMVKETNRRNSLDAIIEETERRMQALEAQRSTTDRRREIRTLRSRLTSLRGQLSNSLQRLKDWGGKIRNLRKTFQSRMGGLLKGLGAGAFAEIGLEIAKEYLTWAIAQEMEQQKDKENERRCIVDTLRTVPHCFAKGSHSMDRKKSRYGQNGNGQNVFDVMKSMVDKTRDVYDNGIDPIANDKYGYPRFAYTWIGLMHQFYNDLEKLLLEGILEKQEDNQEYEWISFEGKKTKCKKKSKGERLTDRF